jgi:hypothetical protein
MGWPGVAQAAVTTDDQHTMLEAHVRLHPGGQLPVAAAASGGLPSDLRPDRLHEHAELPLTANGKIDFAALAQASAAAAVLDSSAPGKQPQHAPLTALVGAAWAEVLPTGRCQPMSTSSTSAATRCLL